MVRKISGQTNFICKQCRYTLSEEDLRKNGIKPNTFVTGKKLPCPNCKGEEYIHVLY